MSLGARQTEQFLLSHAVVVVLAALAWRHRREDADLWLWTLSGFVAVLAGLRFFPHYYLQLLPPLCILATRTLTTWPVFTRPLGPHRDRARPCRDDLVLPRGRRSLARTIAIRRSLSMSLTTCTITLFRRTGYSYWGQSPEVYWASDRLPATRFVTTGFLTGASGGRPPDRVGMQYATPGAWRRFLDDLAKHPPTVIIDMSEANQRNAHFYPPSHFPPFERYLTSGHWRRVAVVDGAGIYRRSGT